MTLIEVVAGLALLATVFTGIVMVKVRVAHQAGAVEQHRQAIVAADEMLSSWWQNQSTFPRAGTGEVPGHPDLIWRTQTVAEPVAQSLGAEVVRLEVMNREPAPTARVLAAVDVALPRRTTP